MKQRPRYPGRFLLLLALLLGGCQAYVARTVLPQDVRDAQYHVRIERNVPMRTSDGIALVSDIYRPDANEKFPTILVRIPFTKTLRNSLGADAVGNFWASRGYNVVIQGTRGRFNSGGEFYPLIHERQDGIETLQWLAKQAWFDGRLGMWGGSAFGHTQWAISDQDFPGPTALAIQIASTDFHGAFYPGGAFSLESALFWAARSHGTADRTPDYAVLERGFSDGPVVEADDRSIGNVAFFDDWARHPQKDDYWRAIDGENRAANLKAPVLLMAGWYDPFLPTQLEDFRTIRGSAAEAVSTRSRLIVGPWTHANTVRFPDGYETGDYRPASLAPSIPWFDQLLAGRQQDPSLASPVRIFVMGENVWRDENEWPLARTQYRSFYLKGSGNANSANGDGRLLDSAEGDDAPDRFDYDPRHPVPTRGGAMLGPRAGIFQQNEIEARSDVLVYSTAPLVQAMEVTGPVKAELFVGTDAPCTDFTVKLVDVRPDGKAYNLSDGILRITSSTTQSPLRIEVELWPTSFLFQKDHRIRIEISSSNFPRYDRNPNTGGFIPTERQTRIARQVVFHGPSAPSRIILPVIPR
jgi:putative CocE/NonD family hydrolase